MLGARLSGSVTADFISTKTHFNFLVLFRKCKEGRSPPPLPHPSSCLLGGPHSCGLCDPLLALGTVELQFASFSFNEWCVSFAHVHSFFFFLTWRDFTCCLHLGGARVVRGEAREPVTCWVPRLSGCREAETEPPPPRHPKSDCLSQTQFVGEPRNPPQACLSGDPHCNTE